MRSTRCFLFFMLLTSGLIADQMTTTVESDSAHYDGHILTLQGHVVVENVMGRLTASHAVLTRDEEGKSKLDFPWLKVSENVCLTLSDGGMLCCEQIEVDYLHSSSILKGPPQMHYKDEESELFADWAQVDYAECKGKLEPKKITLVGNVQMIVQKGKNNKPTLQYALADYVEYYPQEEKMILRGEEERSVLFYDKIKDMQLSARTVNAWRNPTSGKEALQGFGDVRFVFKQEELDKLKERFKWDK